MSNDLVNRSNTFGLLPEPTNRFGSFGVATITNVVVAALLILITAAHVTTMQRHFEQTALVFPTTPPPPIVKVPPAPKLPPPPKVEIAKLEPPKIELPKPQPEPPKPMPVVKPAMAPAPLPAAAAPKAVVLAPQPKATSMFAAAPAVAPVAKPSTQVVHFGDLNGARPNPNASKPANIAAVGNPFGGAQGAAVQPQGKVGSSGFGNGTVVGSSAGVQGKVASAGLPGGAIGGVQGGVVGGVPGGKVGSTGFNKQAVVANAMPKQETTPAFVPIEITSKPTPQYTPEARAAKIEGDVVLRVTFTAGGQVQVLGVVRGLGHGLDEQAKRAAEQIRFRPATKDGHPVDSTTNISITFQLA